MAVARPLEYIQGRKNLCASKIREEIRALDGNSNQLVLAYRMEVCRLIEKNKRKNPRCALSLRGRGIRLVTLSRPAQLP
jgi:hypothetical protein